jgi:hypothetical protein
LGKNEPIDVPKPPPPPLSNASVVGPDDIMAFKLYFTMLHEYETAETLSEWTQHEMQRIIASALAVDPQHVVLDTLSSLRLKSRRLLDVYMLWEIYVDKIYNVARVNTVTTAALIASGIQNSLALQISVELIRVDSSGMPWTTPREKDDKKGLVRFSFLCLFFLY